MLPKYQRQDSKVNVYVTMDGDKMAQVVPTCVYDDLEWLSQDGMTAASLFKGYRVTEPSSGEANTAGSGVQPTTTAQIHNGSKPVSIGFRNTSRRRPATTTSPHQGLDTSNVTTHTGVGLPRASTNITTDASSPGQAYTYSPSRDAISTSATSNGTASCTCTHSYRNGATNCTHCASRDFDEQSVMDINLATGEDSKLEHAARVALLDGDLTPLIKEELKYTIQAKRLKAGKNEMKVEFTEPLPDQLTPEEEVRVEKRRVQNREAAQRFRERQKDKSTVLQKQCQRLETAQTQLKYELHQVRKERDELRQALEQHMAMCPLRAAPTQFYTLPSKSGEHT